MRHDRPCPACDGRRLDPVAAVQPEHLLRCSSCGLVFEWRAPSDQELTAHYGHYGYGRLKPCPPATQASDRQVLRTLAARHDFRVAALRSTGLDPWRLRQGLRPGAPSQATDSVAPFSGADPRNGLRAAVYTLRRVALVKNVVNAMVNVAGAGDTLKAWLVKV